MGAAIQGGWTSRMGLQFRDDCQEHLGMVASLTAWLGSFFGLRAHTGEVCESKEMRCPADTSVTALQVHYGRDDHYDRDFYDFKLRCGTRWQRYLGLRFESPSVWKSNSCGDDASMAWGVRNLISTQVAGQAAREISVLEALQARRAPRARQEPEAATSRHGRGHDP